MNRKQLTRTIMDLDSTEAALRLGKKLHKSYIPFLKKLREEFLVRARKFLKSKDYDKSQEWAFLSQLTREVIETIEGKTNPRFL